MRPRSPKRRPCPIQAALSPMRCSQTRRWRPMTQEPRTRGCRFPRSRPATPRGRQTATQHHPQHRPVPHRVTGACGVCSGPPLASRAIYVRYIKRAEIPRLAARTANSHHGDTEVQLAEEPNRDCGFTHGGRGQLLWKVGVRALICGRRRRIRLVADSQSHGPRPPTPAIPSRWIGPGYMGGYITAVRARPPTPPHAAPAGERELLRRRRQELIDPFGKEGLCDPSRRRRLPRFPRAVGVIAGANSEAKRLRAKLSPRVNTTPASPRNESSSSAAPPSCPGHPQVIIGPQGVLALTVVMLDPPAHLSSRTRSRSGCSRAATCHTHGVLAELREPGVIAVPPLSFTGDHT